MIVFVSDVSVGENVVVDVLINSKVTGNVVVTFKGIDKVVNISNGKGSLEIPDLAVGSYDVLVKYEGDDCFNAGEKSASFKVIEVETPTNNTNASSGNVTDNNTTNVNETQDNTTDSNATIEPDISVPSLDDPSQDRSVTIKLPADATGTVTLAIGGSKYAFDVVEDVAKIAVPDLEDGIYQYNITYSGDGKYSSVATNGTLTVTNPKITVSTTKISYNSGKYYTIKVYESDGKLAKGVKVVIKINGKSFKTATTDNKGIVKFKITQVPGTYQITITSLGKTVTKTLTVTHLVTLKYVTVKKSSKSLVLKASLGKINGKYLKNKQVTFKFNGKTYKAKTNSKGVAKVTVKSDVLKKLKVGKKVTYQATYLKDTVKQTVAVKK